MNDNYVLSEDMIRKMVNQYAPIVYIHNNERYMPIDVEAYLEHTDLFDENNKYVGAGMDINESMSKGYYLKIRHNYIKNGDLDKAKCYVRIGIKPERNDLIAIQYLFFYAFNGPGTLFIHIPRKDRWFNLAPFGEHEGDWENIVVLVNPINNTLYGVVYEQHGDQHYYKPDKIEKINEQIVVYSSLNGHASYLGVGQNPTHEFNLDTLIGSFRRYLMNATGRGVLWNTRDKCQIIEDQTTITQTIIPEWAKYKGHWGEVREIKKEEIPELREISDFSELLADGIWKTLLLVSEGQEHRGGPFGPSTKEFYLEKLSPPINTDC